MKINPGDLQRRYPRETRVLNARIAEIEQAIGSDLSIVSACIDRRNGGAYLQASCLAGIEIEPGQPSSVIVIETPVRPALEVVR